MVVCLLLETERSCWVREFMGYVMSAVKTGTVYVDHAGATLHSDSQLRGALDDLSANLYSNPRIQPFISFFLLFPHLIVHCLRGLEQPKSCELGNLKGGYGR